MLEESPLYGVPVEAIARVCGVNVRTARRWKRQGSAPIAVMKLIRILWDHELGELSRTWSGWSLRHDELISPAGERFSPGVILAGRYHRQRAAEMERQFKQPRQLCL